MRESGLVLGVDVGWAKDKKTTGACVLAWTPSEVTITPSRLATEDRRGVEQLVGEAEILALAVDGPVRGALDHIGVYRDAERMLTRRLGSRIGKPGQTSSGNGRRLNAGANSIAQTVLATGRLGPATHLAKIHERAIVEAFPTTFLGVMLDDGCVPPHGPRSDVYFVHLLGPNANCPPLPSSDRLLGLLQRLLPERRLPEGHLGRIDDHEERAAVVCAITALCVVARKYVAVGDATNGYIVLPPRAEVGESGLQPWAWKIIDENRPMNAPNPIVVE